MKIARKNDRRGEGAIGLLVIVFLIVGGILWWLYSARQGAEKSIRVFSADVAKHAAVDYDEKFLHFHLSPEAQVQFPTSWRDRLIGQLRSLGTPSQPIEVTGDVAFSNYFFDPRGLFRAQLKYPTTFAELELGVSRSMADWQIDTIGLIWTPPTPTPAPAPQATATPPPTPAQKAKRSQ